MRYKSLGGKCMVLQICGVVSLALLATAFHPPCWGVLFGMARLVDGWEAWRISTVCAACGRVILACDKAYVEGGKVYHASCYRGGGSTSTPEGIGGWVEPEDREVEVILDGE